MKLSASLTGEQLSVEKKTMTRTSVSYLLIVSLTIFCSVLAVQAGGRFVDNNDGTVTDTSTRLMWAKEDNLGNINWHDAAFYCKNPPLAGYRYSNWRLPTVAELRTLYAKELAPYPTDCGLRVRNHAPVRLSCAWIWASEHSAISAYVFNFNKGYAYSTLMLDQKKFRALAVRNLESK